MLSCLTLAEKEYKKAMNATSITATCQTLGARDGVRVSDIRCGLFCLKGVAGAATGMTKGETRTSKAEHNLKVTLAVLGHSLG